VPMTISRGGHGEIQQHAMFSGNQCSSSVLMFNTVCVLLDIDLERIQALVTLYFPIAEYCARGCSCICAEL